MSGAILRLVVVVLLTWSPVQSGQAARAPRVIVFAAASLGEAFEEIAAGFEAGHAGVEVIFSFGGSSTLAAQLAEGAPADVFASADERQMRVAREAGRIVAPASTFALNHLVVITPRDNPGHIETLLDLATPGVLLVLAAPEVPARRYTELMLERLAAEPGFGEEYRRAVMANIVSEEPDVRHVAAKVALGEADVGVVYRSDVTADLADQLRIIPIPDASRVLAHYRIAVTNDTDQPELAQAFVDYILSEAGQATLARRGFLPVTDEARPHGACAVNAPRAHYVPALD